LEDTTATLKDNLVDLQEKAKERTVRTQNIEYDLETLVKKIKGGIIKLDPDYQRRHRWDDTKSSRLIESLVLNIPIPLIYLSQDVDVDVEQDLARYSVIDGQQRLRAIVRYFSNEFELEGLEVLDKLNKTFYEDLPPFLRRRLEERTIRCLRIDSTIDPQVKYDIFERLNSGAVKLEAQELRNAAARGPFNDLLKDLAQNSDYRVMLQIDPKNPKDSKKVQKMLDVEYVLRFFALRKGKYKEFKKGFGEYLTAELESGNKLGDDELENRSSAFKILVSRIRKTFGDEAFAKYQPDGDQLVLNSRFNASVYDALMVGIESECDLTHELPFDLVGKWKSLFFNKDFLDAITVSVSDSSKVTSRIDKARAAFKDVNIR